MKGKGKDKKAVVVKAPFAPEREPLVRPKLDPEAELEELKKTKAYEANNSTYFPQDMRTKIGNIFKLFDRDEKNGLTFDELKEVLVATNNVYEDQDLLRGLFNLRKKPLDGGTTPQDSYKIDLDDLMIILSKKMKDNDKKQDLMTAFAFVTKDDPVRPKTPPKVLTEDELREGIVLPVEPKKEKGPMAHTEKFYEKLIYAGYRFWNRV